jgi:hypothetical protein
MDRRQGQPYDAAITRACYMGSPNCDFMSYVTAYYKDAPNRLYNPVQENDDPKKLADAITQSVADAHVTDLILNLMFDQN